METFEEKADRAAFEHTVYMAIADLYATFRPNVDMWDFVEELKSNKESEKRRLLDEWKEVGERGL